MRPETTPGHPGHPEPILTRVGRPGRRTRERAQGTRPQCSSAHSSVDVGGRGEHGRSLGAAVTTSPQERLTQGMRAHMASASPNVRRAACRRDYQILLASLQAWLSTRSRRVAAGDRLADTARRLLCAPHPTSRPSTSARPPRWVSPSVAGAFSSSTSPSDCRTLPTWKTICAQPQHGSRSMGWRNFRFHTHPETRITPRREPRGDLKATGRARPTNVPLERSLLHAKHTPLRSDAASECGESPTRDDGMVVA